MTAKRFIIPLCALLLTWLLAGSVALAQIEQPLLEGDAAIDQLDQSEAFLNSSGLQPVHPSILVAQIIQVLLGLLGIVFIILIIYAGFSWMTSAGNEERISKAKKTIVAAIIGLTIILSAYLITAFLISQLFEATQAY